MKPNNRNGFIPKHGGYKNLITYQKSEVIYDGTIYFTNRFLKNPIVLSTKWYKLHEVANKIL